MSLNGHAPSYPHILLLLGLGGVVVRFFWNALRSAFREPSVPPPLPGMDILQKSRQPPGSASPEVYQLNYPPPETANAAVIFVPGAGGCAENFTRQAHPFSEDLASHASATLFDHPGHGSKAHIIPPAAALSLDSLKNALVQHYRNVTENRPSPSVRVLIVAHSYGCAITSAALPSMPSVYAVIYLAPPVQSRLNPFRSFLLHCPAFIVSILRAVDRTDFSGKGPAGTMSVRRMLGYRAGAHLASWQLYWNSLTSTTVVQTLGRQAKIPTGEQYASVLATIGVRAWVLVGERDHMCPPCGMFGVARGVQVGATLQIVPGDYAHQIC